MRSSYKIIRGHVSVRMHGNGKLLCLSKWLLAHAVALNCFAPKVQRWKGGGTIGLGVVTWRWLNLASRAMPVFIHQRAWRIPA